MLITEDPAHAKLLTKTFKPCMHYSDKYLYKMAKICFFDDYFMKILIIT